MGVRKELRNLKKGTDSFQRYLEGGIDRNWSQDVRGKKNKDSAQVSDLRKKEARMKVGPVNQDRK